MTIDLRKHALRACLLVLVACYGLHGMLAMRLSMSHEMASPRDSRYESDSVLVAGSSLIGRAALPEDLDSIPLRSRERKL